MGAASSGHRAGARISGSTSRAPSPTRPFAWISRAGPMSFASALMNSSGTSKLTRYRSLRPNDPTRAFCIVEAERLSRMCRSAMCAQADGETRKCGVHARLSTRDGERSNAESPLVVGLCGERLLGKLAYVFVVGLAVRCAGEVRFRQDALRYFVRSDARLDEILQYALVEFRVLFQLHDCRDRLTPLRIGDADHQCIGDRWMRFQRLLDLFGIHLFTGGVDAIAAASEQRQRTVRFDAYP